jgi:glycosyltransferase involved in cell wall biosynthesis
MNASELVLLTSAFEASPVVIREALACNVPVLSTDVGDARVMLNGIEGCAIVDADPGRIADALHTALGRPRRVAARDRMRAHSLEAVAETLKAHYARVIAQHGNGRA